MISPPLQETKIDLLEWQTRRPLHDPCLRNLFLDADEQTKTLAESISRSRILRIYELREGLMLSSTSYVGRLRIGSLTVTVHPKIASMDLARLLRYAYGLRHLHTFRDVEYAAQHGAFQEILIRQLIEEIQELLARGMHRRYLRREADLSSPRERVDMKRFIGQSGRDLATLPCFFHPRSIDCPENQVLHAGLRLAHGLTEDMHLRADLRFLIRTLKQDIAEVDLTSALLHKVSKAGNRLTTAYIPALTIIDMLQRGCGVGLSGEAPAIRLAGFMFDMNRFFQALISRYLRDNLPDYHVRDEYRLKGMLEYSSGSNPLGRRAPTLRPDFVVLKNRAVVSVLDAKYRDLWENPLPRDMLYQLAMYALAQPSCKRAVIIYPTISAEAEQSRIIVKDPSDQSRIGEIIVRPVHLGFLAELLVAEQSMAIARKRAEFAESLIA